MKFCVRLYQDYRQGVNRLIMNWFFYLFVIPGGLIIDLDIPTRLNFAAKLMNANDQFK